jgi:hypothetical protein
VRLGRVIADQEVQEAAAVVVAEVRAGLEIKDQMTAPTKSLQGFSFFLFFFASVLSLLLLVLLFLLMI